MSRLESSTSSTALFANQEPTLSKLERQHREIPAAHQRHCLPTAVVYCESRFASKDGKTANGLVRHSGKYRIMAVIDSLNAGQDAGVALDGAPVGIPVCASLDAAVDLAGHLPDYFIFGMAPADGMLSPSERRIVLDAIGRGMHVVSGLHEFLHDDPEIANAAALSGVEILDVRRPRAQKLLRMFSGQIYDLNCPRIAVMGTDCAVGKRTTATVLIQALTAAGMKAILISTGQTGLIQGARYGVALDAVPSQFCSGEVEALIIEACENESPDVIVIEGQGALSHPALSTSSLILRGCHPHAVVLQHAPMRRQRCDFEYMPVPTPASEIALIEAFAKTRVIGITINHEDMTSAEIEDAVERLEAELGLPVIDALLHPPQRLVEMVLASFPQLRRERLAIVT